MKHEDCQHIARLVFWHPEGFAELMFMLYGTLELPEIVYKAKGKPAFRDKNLPSFSIAYAGNMVGVTLTTEGECGLDMELQRATRGFISPHSVEVPAFSSIESLWISKQNDPDEARAQMITLRQSLLKLMGTSVMTIRVNYNCCRGPGV